MNHSISSKRSISSDSSAESIAESALKTPLDPSPPSTYVPIKMPTTIQNSKLFSSRLEFTPKRSNSSAAMLESHQGHTMPRRARRPTIESLASMNSRSSSRSSSLLRTTLLLVTSTTTTTSISRETSSSRPYSPIESKAASARQLTPQTSFSSLASTSQTSHASRSADDDDEEDDKCSKRLGLCNAPTFTADATIALSPTSNSTSLAQFSTVPAASASLLQFGIAPTPTPSTSLSLSSSSSTRSPSAGRDKTRRRRSRDGQERKRHSTLDERASSPGAPNPSIPPTRWLSATFSLGASPSKKSLLQQPTPSISRALVPDEPEENSIMGGDKSASPTALNIPGVTETWERVGGQNIVSTPRPAFPIDNAAQQQPPSWAWENNKAGNTNLDAGTKLTAVDKGKGRAIPPLVPTLQRTASAPAPQTKANATAIATPPAPTSSILAPPARTWKGVTRAEHKYDPNLPSLAAVESNSRLMRAKIVCATCGEVGPDFPRCGRCSEAWCSRACRVEANKVSGGKHRCSPSVA